MGGGQEINCQSTGGTGSSSSTRSRYMSCSNVEVEGSYVVLIYVQVLHEGM